MSYQIWKITYYFEIQSQRYSLLDELFQKYFVNVR